MASLKDMKNRMRSIQTTRQITSTMKVVSLAKVKKSHARLTEATTYIDEMNRVVRRLIRAAVYFQRQKTDDGVHISKLKLSPMFIGNGFDERYVVVCVTSDDGLSGSGNMQVLQKTKEVVDYLTEAGKEITLVCFGTRGAEILKRFYPDLSVHIMKRKSFSASGAYLDGERLTLDLMASFEEKRFDACIVVFNHFESMIVQTPVIEQLIPNRLFSDTNPWQFLMDTKLDSYREKDVLGRERLSIRHKSFLEHMGRKLKAPLIDVLAEELKKSVRPVTAYDYEPDATEILNRIFPAYMIAYVNYILLESDVCDQAARLMAMDNATHNADEMLANLTKVYQRTRQNKITTQTAELAQAKG
ncbi:MAG: F0F1 ATP synthase subunit gamma [Alphaproteobacteria bacterium]|nr:F0F1 ATP synthase subunit gamma [Alphaproteobacteria bacterium]